MEVSKKQIDAKLREKYLDIIIKFFSESGEEVLRTKSNEIALPVVDDSGEDNFVTVTIKIPSGSRQGEPYDGYEMAEDYAHHLTEKAEKEKKAKAQKAKKIERDKKMRQIAKEKKEKREGK